MCRAKRSPKFQSRARYDGRVKILKPRRIAATFALNLKPIGDRAEFQDRSIREAVRHRSIRKAAPIDPFAAPRAEILDRFEGYKQRNAAIRTRGFDGTGR